MKTHRTLSFRNLIVSLLLASLVVAGCSPASSAPPLPKSGGIGKVVSSILATAQSIAGSLKQDRTSATSPTQQAGTFTLGMAQSLGSLTITPTEVGHRPMVTSDGKPGQDEVLIVNVMVENTSKTDTAKFKPSALTMADQFGHTYGAWLLAPLPGDLTWQSMKPGDSAEGWVAFRVPLRATELAFEIKDANGHKLDWAITG